MLLTVSATDPRQTQSQKCLRPARIAAGVRCRGPRFECCDLDCPVALRVVRERVRGISAPQLSEYREVPGQNRLGLKALAQHRGDCNSAETDRRSTPKD